MLKSEKLIIKMVEESKIETMDVGTYSTVMFGLRLNRLIVREN